MPLVRFDMIEGRTDDAIKTMLNATHRVLVASFGIPEHDRYQIVNEHPDAHFVIEDTGLGIARTRACVVIEITTRPHERLAKEKLYQLLSRELQAKCDLAPSDLVVSIVTNTDEDWSFGGGRAQFLTGELPSDPHEPR